MIVPAGIKMHLALGVGPKPPFTLACRFAPAQTAEAGRCGARQQDGEDRMEADGQRRKLRSNSCRDSRSRSGPRINAIPAERRRRDVRSLLENE